ncbi:ATP-binding protein [Lentzea sp. NBRC 105346]|nr:ATP-binding protein [Lentzea sp. NBRC 105346]
MLAADELAKPWQLAKLDHLVEGIGHQVTEQLDPVLERCGSLPDNEIEAALTAVLDALAEIDLSDDALLSDDADPEQLAERIRREVPAPAGLAEGAERLYGIALDQACRYLVQVIRHLPSFQPRALAEVLSRAAAQTARLDELLARVPRTSLHAPQGTANDAEFRDEYLRYLATSLDRLELLGLSMKNRPKLALSVAYLSLSASGSSDSLFEQRLADELSAIRVESAMSRRTLVRGEAGSGKTTLLDWLAITAARGRFTDDMQSWNGCIPFPIRLRRYADAPLPKPEEFLDHGAGPLAGMMPKLWVHRALKSGHGLVLVDGVDEVPPGKRHLVREWLRELCTAFPEARFVVSSRPAAADQKWLGDLGFKSVLLEQMNPADVRRFLERWHVAARDADSLPCPVDALPAAQRRLQNQLDNRDHLQSLAANPLLCAMLCALNLSRTSELPSSRMELYQAALTMLLDLRDAEREIAGLLTATEKTVLLRDLAWRLTLGNRSQLPTPKVREHVTRKVRAMPNVVVDAETIVSHLLERSGVVREPVPGQVDFVHRTFQEYLAGAEAMQDGQIETLAGHAHQDSWSETIVLACGHGQRSQVSELLGDILDRADREPRHARRLRLLAAACLETVPDVAPDVHDRVNQVIENHLVPPRSLKETHSLVTIGHRVLRYLPASLDSLSDAVARATVRAAAATGAPEAIAKLACYAGDARSCVQTELAAAWQHYDPERYAKEVLAEAPLDDGRIVIGTTRQVPHLGLLRYLSAVHLNLDVSDHQRDLAFLDSVPHLERLQVRFEGRVDLTPLTAHSRLHTLSLTGAHSFDNYAVLSELPELRSLQFTTVLEHQDLDFLRHVPDVELLSVGPLSSRADLTGLDHVPQVYYFSCTEWPSNVNLGPLGRLQNLRSLRLGYRTHTRVLRDIATHLPQLTRLWLAGTACADISPVAEHPNLRWLSLAYLPEQGLGPLRGKSITVSLPSHLKGVLDVAHELSPNVTIEWRN